MIYYSQGIQSPTNKGKRCMGQSWRKPGTSFHSHSGVTHLIPPETSGDNTCDICQGSSLETQGPRFSLGLITQTPSALHVLKCKTPRRKADVQYKPYCLYKQFRHSETLLSVRVMGTFLKSRSPDASQRPILQTALSKGNSLRPTMLILFVQLALPFWGRLEVMCIS